MPTQILMPQLGEAVDEATITRWLKAEGDPVEEFEPLVEVNTDKVDTEIPAPAAGTLLKIVVAEEGAQVKVGMLLGWIGQPGEAIPEGGPAMAQASAETAATAADQPAAPAISPASAGPARVAEVETAVPAVIAPAPDRDLGFISPVVARMAAEHGLDLRQVPGSGLKGRITRQDVQRYLEQGPPAPAAASVDPTVSAATPAAADSQAAAAVGTPASGTPTPGTPTPGTPTSGTVIPHSTMRRRIAEHMVNSKRTSPHVTTVFEADLSRVIAHREANKAAFARDGVKLTFTAYFTAATAAALKAYPVVNSSWSEQGLILHPAVNIGMATSLGEEGLIVPVIKGADNLSLLGLARTINDLAERARAKQLAPDEVQGGTFTITNHGISGSLFAAPIISQPQCAILGIGKLQKRVMVLTDEFGNDTIAIRPMVYLTLTFDHRILDGAIADYFLARLVQSLENWS